MLAPNLPTLDAIRTMPIGDISGLPADHLALLQEEADAHLDAAKHLKDWLEGAIALRYADHAATLRRDEGKDTGTIRFEDGGVTVIADLPKRVDWEQGQLATIVERIRAGGDDAGQYVDVAYKVPERKYGAWPDHIRTVFEPARTVRTGKASFQLKLLRP